ncbi:hypothetical protein P5704_027270 (plasmid) [Pseudomonas sp. FeN3W]|nr:hypothetical protein P5704_027270 [Pseudomonas sp. FeN3W]
MKKTDLFDYDDFINVREEFSVDDKNGLKVGDYVYGRCHLFALALARQLRMKIGIFVDEECIPDGGEEPIRVLVHAFCVLDNDRVIDARGVRYKIDMLREFSPLAFEFNELAGKEAEAQLNEWMSNEPALQAKSGEESALRDYIKDMCKFGVLDAKEQEFGYS